MFSNLKVIELASVLAGPAVGMFFTELGATVIKVENLRTSGDVTRSWKLPTENPETTVSAYFSSINWGKKSIAIDLREASGQAIVHQLVQQADVVISSFLPGSAEKLRMDAETLLALNPQLICASINGYGPEERRAAYDGIIQAESGFTYLNGLPGQTSKMPVALMDILAAHQLKEAVLLAYIQRLQTGQGKEVHVSLLESGISSLANQATNWLVAHQLPQPKGSDHPNIVPYGTQYPTADGKTLILAVGSDKQFSALCEVLGDEVPNGFERNSDRVKHREKVNDWLANKISQWNLANLLEILLAKKVPAGGVNSMKEVFELPLAKEMLLKSPEMTGVSTFVGKGIHDFPSQLSPPPQLGENTEEVLLELGYVSDEIQALKNKQIIG